MSYQGATPQLPITDTLGYYLSYNGTTWIGVPSPVPATATNGYVLTYQTGSGWVAQEAPSGLPTGSYIGEILYWNGSSWVLSNAPTSGYYLSYNGTNPVWATAPSGGGALPSASANQLTYYNGSSWVTVTAPVNANTQLTWNGSNFVWNPSLPTSPLNFEIPYYYGYSWHATVQPSDNGQVLTYNAYAGMLLWQSPPSGLPTGSYIGEILYWNGSSWVLSNAPTSGYYLSYNGTNPIWAVPDGGGGGALTFQQITASATVSATSGETCVECTYTGTLITVTLPASPGTGQKVNVKDKSGSAATHPITVSGNGNNIDGTSTFVLSSTNEADLFIFNGASWGVY